MRFILTFGTLSKIDSLRAQYEAERKIDLSQPCSKFGISLFFGSINVEARHAQIKFLEKINMVLQPNLIKQEDLNTPDKWLAHLTASRVMIAACLYVQSQISRSKSKSVLYRLIDDCLGVTAENYFDDDDQKICFLAANRIINSSKMALEQVNEALMTAKMTLITEIEWYDFSLYIQDGCRVKTIDNFYANYPVTSITKPLFGNAFLYSGATIGYLSGIVLNNSPKASYVRHHLANYIGDKLLFDPLGPIGVALLAPTIASHLLTTYCSFALTHMTGRSMEVMGKGLGMCVGLPFDLAYQLLCKTSSVMSNWSNQSIVTDMTGLRIVDGAYVLNGLLIELTPDAPLVENTKLTLVEICDDKEGYLNIDLEELADLRSISSAANGINP
jgi:hypothetical protein